MDEPLGALDKKLREWLQLLEISASTANSGTTFVYVTHDQEEALVLSDRIVMFNGGRIEQIGTGRELYDNPATLFVGRFIGESTVLRGAAEATGNDTVMTVGDQKVPRPWPPCRRCPPGHSAQARARGVEAAPARTRLPARTARQAPSPRRSISAPAKYEIRLRDGTVAVRSPLGAADFSIGETVDLAFTPADLTLLPDDASADVTLT